VDELQEALEQATKGIAALATGPWIGRATQLDAAASVSSAQVREIRSPLPKV